MTFASQHGLNAPLTPLRFLQRSAQVHPNKIAAVDGPRRITFAEFNEDAQAFAHALITDQVAEGDRVGTSLRTATKPCLPSSPCRWLMQ